MDELGLTEIVTGFVLALLTYFGGRFQQKRKDGKGPPPDLR